MDNPKPPAPPSPPHANTSSAANSRSLENIKSLLLKCAIASTPAKKSITPHQQAFIEKRIEQIFPNVHTPDHPPYAWMIENAIRQLNEDCGSTEESISKLIIKEYKDLPFAHASLLRHHLKKLAESGNLFVSRNGCYSIDKSRILQNSTSDPNPELNNTTSLSPEAPDFSYSSSPSLSPSCSSSSEYESSSTYSSSECYVQIRKARKKKKRKKIKRKRSQNARGIQIRTKHDSGRGRGRGKGRSRGRGRGRGRGLGSNRKTNHTKLEAIGDHQYTTVNNDVVDENVKGNRSQDSIEVDNRVGEERIEPLWQEKLVGGVDNGLTPSTSSTKNVIISGQGSKNVGPCQRDACSMGTPQRDEEQGRPFMQDIQIEEYGNNMEMTNVEERDADMDMLDELIEEVYMELKGEETECECLEIQVDHAELMQCELNLQRMDDEIYEPLGLEPLERECRTDEEDVGSGTHVVNENQFQPQPGQTELTLPIQESNEIEQQVQLKGTEMEIIGQIDVYEGETNCIENAFEVAEEQNEHIEISEGLDCDFLNRERTVEEEFWHCDELEKIENVNENSEELYNSEKSRADEHPHEPQVEDRDQQSEELARVFSEQAVNVTVHDHQPKDETNEINDVEPLEQDHKSTDDEVAEEQNEHIKISEGLSCFLLNKERTVEEEIGHCDELEKIENVNENSEERYTSEKSRAEEHPHEPQVEDRDQQSEQLARVFSEQPVNVADNDQQKDETNEINDVEPLEDHKSTDDDPDQLQLQECTFTKPKEPEDVVIINQKLLENELESKATNDGQLQLKGKETEMIEENEHIEQPEPLLEQNQPEKRCEELRLRELQIGNGEDQKHQNGKETLKTEVNSKVEPQRRQLRPRPLKFQQDRTQGQFGLSTPEKSVETNTIRKLRPRPSKNEPNETPNKAARHALQKRQK